VKAPPESLLEPALGAGVISPGDDALVRAALAARRQVIEVDSFSPEAYYRSVPTEAEASVLAGVTR
jgi:hypothetical protein